MSSLVTRMPPLRPGGRPWTSIPNSNGPERAWSVMGVARTGDAATGVN